MLGSILAVLGPILLGLVKDFLPQILSKLLSKWLNPLSDTDTVKATLDEALAEGDLKDLGHINDIVISNNGQNELTPNNLDNMLKMVQ